MNNTTNYELNPAVFTLEYITTHLFPVIQRPSDDNSLAKEPFLDLELTYKVIIKDTDTGCMSYRLTKALAESLHLDMDYIRNCDILNNADKVTCQSLAEIFGIPDTMMDMYVISNNSKNLGAGTAFLCTAPMKKLCKEWNTDQLVVIPSSRHELLIIRENTADAEFINQMIIDVNEQVVDEQDRLSDHHYIYHKDSDSFTY